MREDTAEGSRGIEKEEQAQPGLLVVFSAGKTLSLPLPLGAEPLVLGRVPGNVGVLLPDERLSRSHASVARSGAGWEVRDLGSRNGTFVDGAQITGTISVRAPRVIRVADTLLLPSDDVRAFVAQEPRDGPGAPVVGARLREALDAVAQAATASSTLVIQGESGSGKELAARRFHARGPHAGGPFVAVNCAAIPEGLAERLLFGAKRGAYSGATADAIGHVQAASGGVLFLDEVGDLNLLVQAKLLRALEAREVIPLGASTAQPVNVRVCVATHRNLREAVAAGRFRADLYYRLAPPAVTLPPLRERLDEITLHLEDEIASVASDLSAHVRLVEACLLRRWPGNVRELRKEIHHAAARALSDGAAHVRVEYLSESAGRELTASTDASAEGPAEAPAEARKRAYVRWGASLTREDIERALADAQGSIADAAKRLGMHRAQLYREMERWSVKPPAGPAERG